MTAAISALTGSSGAWPFARQARWGGHPSTAWAVNPPSARRAPPRFYAIERELGGRLPEWSPGWPELLPVRYRIAYGHAQQAELLLEDAELEALTRELLGARDEAELERFLGRLVSKVSRAASSAARTVGRGVSAVGRLPVVRDMARTASSAARGVTRGLQAVNRAVPLLGTVAKLASHSPLGALARGTWGAVSALARGENVLMGALDGIAGTPLLRGMVKIGGAVLRGENLAKAAKQALDAGIADAREAVRFAAMVAPFVPGIGTGVGAALGAANALASGRPITEALIEGVRGAIPGGAIAQAAFDTAAALARGQRVDQALLGAARNQLPPGPARAAFDTGLALAQGKKFQEAALAGASRLLPPSPYAADAISFARKALAGEDLRRAALSTAGEAVLRRARQQGGDIIGTAQRGISGVAAPLARKAPLGLLGLAAQASPALRAAAQRSVGRAAAAAVTRSPRAPLRRPAPRPRRTAPRSGRPERERAP